MDRKKAYTRLSIALGVFFLYSLFWLIKFFVTSGTKYNMGWQFWVTHLFTVVGIAGLIVFVTSDFKNSALLRLFMCKVIIGLPASFFYEYNFLSNFDKYKGDVFSYISVADILLITVSSVAGLWMLTRDRVPALKHYMIGTESAVAEFSPASGWKRFANYMVDIVFIYYIIFNYLDVVRYWSFLNRNGYRYSYRDSYGYIPVLVPLISLMFYYFILEGIFNTTAGKCATNTVVVNSSGEVPSVGQRLGRTLCRLIPFEAFSFLGKNARGWHDTITDTYVVASTDKYEEKETDDELSGFLSEHV
jgi:uncharacterized RDD family membrane protein YckC